MQDFNQLLGSNGTDVNALGAQFGLNADQARTALGSLLPAIVGGFHKQAEVGDPADVVNAASAVQQPDRQSGNDVLGQIFGTKDVSRQVADHASAQSGISSTVLKAMLPIVAAMVAKHVATSGAGQNAGGLGGDQPGGLGSILGSVLGGGGQAGAGGGGLGRALGGLFGGGGNPLDEILGGLRR